MKTSLKHYGLALAAVAAATSLSVALLFWNVHEYVALLAFPAAALVAAWIGGLGPGLFASAVSTAACLYFIFEPIGRFAVASAQDRNSLGLFTGVSVALSVALGSVNRARKVEAQVADAVCKSEAKYRLMFEHNPEPMFVVDTRTLRFVSVNQQAIAKYGYSEKEFLALSIFDIRFPEEVPLMVSDIERNSHAIPDEIFRPAIWRHRAKDGRAIYVEVSGARMSDQNCWLVLARDVSERIRAEGAMRDAEEMWRSLLENSDDYFVVLDENDRIRFVNRPLPGFTEAELRGRPIYEFAVADGQDKMRADIADVRSTGKALMFEGPALGSKTSVAWYEGRCVPVKRDGRVGMLLLVFTDVTVRRTAASELQQAKESAEAASHAKDRFIAALSHELRTPLTPVLAALSVPQPHCPELAPMLSMVRRNVELEAHLIDDLLDVSRVIAGKLLLAPEIVDLHSLVGHAIDVCSPEIQAKNLSILVDLKAKDRWVRADPLRLEQAFWNILRNAIKFSLVSGVIKVACQNLVDGRVTVSVTDSGCGIPAEDMTRIFHAFEQGPMAAGRGLGLGLAIGKGIVDATGGTITAASEGLEQGATFTIDLPTESTPRTVRPVDAVYPLSAVKQRILLVEDDADTRETLRDLLQDCQYEVETAADLASALEHVAAAKFDVLISDIGLPDGSGLDLVEQVHAHQPVPAISLSGYGTDEDVRRSKAAGFAAHLTKPITLDRLRVAIRRIVTQSSTRSDQAS